MSNVARENGTASGRQQIMVRLAIKGQLYSNEDNANYVFPKSDNKQWLDCIPNDPRRDIQPLRLEGNGVECFSLWYKDGKTYYAYRRMLPGRGGSDCAMLVLCCERLVADGGVLVTIMRDIFDYCIRLTSSFDIQDEIIREKLSSLKFAPVGIQGLAGSKNLAEQPATEAPKNAYRTYDTEEELINALENPYQSSYAAYSRILIVQKSLLPQVKPGIDEVIERVKQNYFVRNSPDSAIVGGRTIIESGESFKISYRKSGYNDYSTEALRVGSMSPYISVEGNEIIVKTAEAAGVKFKKDIHVNLKDSLGNPIVNWDCTIRYKDGSMRSCKSLDNKGCITLPDNTFECVFSALGYQTVKKTIDAKKDNSVSLKMERKGNSVKFFLFPAWGNPFTKSSGQISPIEASLPNNDPFYKKYHDELFKSHEKFYVSKLRPLYVVLIFSILTLAIGLFIGSKLSSSPTTETATGTAPTEEAQKEKNDVGKLTSSPVWKVNDMESKKYKKFLEDLMSNPDKVDVGKYKELEKNKEWKDFCDVKKDGNKKEEYNTRLQLLKACKARKTINWKEINMTETQKEEQDVKYLTQNNQWKASALLSKKYKDLLKYLETNNPSPSQWIDNYQILKTNKYWKFFSDKWRTDIPFSTKFNEMLTTGDKTLDWTTFDSYVRQTHQGSRAGNQGGNGARQNQPVDPEEDF